MTLPRLPGLASHRALRLGRFSLGLDRPLIMGVVNITPDSFSDGGRYFNPVHALDHARQLIEEGADILDIGGESSRPGSQPVDLDEELRRVMPVLERLAPLPVPVSVDTCKPELMRRAVDAGAAMINDINALRAPDALDALSGTSSAVCLMHMRGQPRTMQQDPHYQDVVAEVSAYLAERVQAATHAGITRDRIVVDPGFGFGKTAEHNLTLLRELRHFEILDLPLLVGLSRKAVLGKITGRSAPERDPASVAAALLAVQRGAAIVRVHDVEATRDALQVLNAVENLSSHLAED